VKGAAIGAVAAIAVRLNAITRNGPPRGPATAEPIKGPVALKDRKMMRSRKYLRGLPKDEIKQTPSLACMLACSPYSELDPYDRL